MQSLVGTIFKNGMLVVKIVSWFSNFHTQPKNIIRIKGGGGSFASLV